jgi:hypothetical protein
MRVIHSGSRCSGTPFQTQIVPRTNLCETAFARTNVNDKNELENAKAKPESAFEFLLTFSSTMGFLKKVRRERLSASS